MNKVGDSRFGSMTCSVASQRTDAVAFRVASEESAEREVS